MSATPKVVAAAVPARPSGQPAHAAAAEALLDTWLASRGWHAFAFQRAVWQAWWRGESGLLHAPTGAGKTLAVLLGPLALARLQQDAQGGGRSATRGVRLLWITPMRALASDSAGALRAAVETLGLDWQVAVRTGDTASAERARQDRGLPQILVTTPESLTLMLASATRLAALDTLTGVIVDEWHELLGSKRGVQVELALAHLRQRLPRLQVWGMSATLGNLEEARDTLLAGAPGALVHGAVEKRLLVESLIPATLERFPWAGHLGMRQLDGVVALIEAVPGTLVFTNTRAQSEIWYQALLERRPDWAGELALHHGSIDREVRRWVEEGLRSGSLRCVVCTSSLDLGVDFAPVAQVLQIGSPKGVARLAQRAGRSGHAPGQTSRVVCVPTHAFELLEAAATRRALLAGRIEARMPVAGPIDVLVQHLLTLATGAGFRPAALLQEVRTTRAYRELSDADWAWTLEFIQHGGCALQAYPDYRKVAIDADGLWRVQEPTIARRHRMSIGTIVADGSMEVRFLRGARLGQVEEGFIARLSKGDCFSFAGRVLELVRVDGMTALVRAARGTRATVPRWQGGKMPLSSELAHGVRTLLAEWQAAHLPEDRQAAHLPEDRQAVHLPVDRHADGTTGDRPQSTQKPLEPELQALAPILRLQQRWSGLPTPDTLLMERISTREGWHLFVFPCAGRRVHGALAALLAWRLAQRQPVSFSMAWNDYGLELVTAEAGHFTDAALAAALQGTPDGTQGEPDGDPDAALRAALLGSLNAAELQRRQFREIARVAGLVFQGYPGSGKSARQVQVSSSLLFDVLSRFDPGNLLLRQAQQEVLERELGFAEVRAFLHDLPRRTLRITEPPQVTPFAFPLLVERLRERISTESLADRVARMQRQLEQAADAR